MIGYMIVIKYLYFNSYDDNEEFNCIKCINLIFICIILFFVCLLRY